MLYEVCVQRYLVTDCRRIKERLSWEGHFAPVLALEGIAEIARKRERDQRRKDMKRIVFEARNLQHDAEWTCYKP
jgi:hypothetical protein